MKKICRLHVYDTDTFIHTRQKIHALTQELHFPHIQATRFTTIVSEFFRLGIENGGSAELMLRLTPRGHTASINFTFNFTKSISPPNSAANFFDELSVSTTDNGTSISTTLSLPDDAPPPSPKRMKRICAMLSRPSRKELLRELTQKNTALGDEIREHERTEALLRESEKRIHTVLEGTPDPMIIVDQSGIITYANLQAEKTFGYTRDELLGNGVEMLVPAETRPTHPERIKKFFDSPEYREHGIRSEAEAEVKGGKRIFVDIKLSPIDTPSGTQAIASIRDVTEQKDAQEAIRKLSLVVEQSPIPVAIANKDGIVEYINPAYSSVSGYTPREILGNRPLFFQNNALSKEETDTLLSRLQNGEVWHGVIHNSRKSGEDYWESATIAPIISPDGNITHYVSIKEDITERIMMEETLRESELKYRQLVENANSLILKITPDGVITFFNEYAQEFFGFTSEEVVGKHMVGTIAPELDSSGRDMKDLIADMARTPDANSHIEIENMRKDGSHIFVSWTNRALLNETSGEVIGMLCVGLDVTAQRKAQLERAKAAQALDARNKELADLSTKLSKYLSPQVYASIFSGAWDVKLTTRRKKLTVFFCDIKDFTRTTDDLQPEDLTALLNRYFTEMSRIGLEYGATIDKFIGDAMLMFFGDPQSNGVREDAKACVLMAIAMQRRMAELGLEWRSAGYEKPFCMRIGINTGYCNVGNFGSEDRMDYTIIGGEVNLAARLESKADPGGILISYETYALVKDMIAAEERPPMTVKGIRRHVRPYSVLGLYQDMVDSGRFISCQNDGLELKLDLDKITPDIREQTVKELENAISKLKSRG